jgi:predicted dehydrogenase
MATDPSRTYRIAVIGCGTVSRYGHLPAIAESDRWQLAAVCDRNQQALRDTADMYHVKHTYEDPMQMFAEVPLDAVVIATHVDTHAPLTVAALERGLHVLCEKPMANNLDDCQRMVDAARKHARLLAINFNTRSGRVYRRIKQVIDEGSLGRIHVARFIYNWSAHQWKPIERVENFMRNGGPIIDSGVHFFDGLRWFTGEQIDVQKIRAHGVTLPPYDAPQHVIATCQLSGGALGLVEVGWLYCKQTRDQGSQFQIEVIGQTGTLSFDAATNQIKVYTQTDTQTIDLFDATNKDFATTYDLLARSIDDNTLHDLGSAEDGLAATKAAYAALASAKG